MSESDILAFITGVNELDILPIIELMWYCLVFSAKACGSLCMWDVQYEINS